MDAVTGNSTFSYIPWTMEGIQMYYSGGGATPKSFKQDAKAFYARMLRDSQEHLLAGFGQWEFLALLGARLSGEARCYDARGRMHHSLGKHKTRLHIVLKGWGIL